MASRRTVMANDRKRTSAARKRSHKETLERAQQQATVVQKLWTQAKQEAKAAKAG